MTYVIDIDDTLLIYPKHAVFADNKYNCALPNKDEIKRCNELFDSNTIILHTGRNWDKYEFTKKQMERFGIKYHELVMGKPQGIYIDKDSYKSLKDVK
jgi:hypothetical protein